MVKKYLLVMALAVATLANNTYTMSRWAWPSKTTQREQQLQSRQPVRYSPRFSFWPSHPQSQTANLDRQIAAKESEWLKQEIDVVRPAYRELNRAAKADYGPSLWQRLTRQTREPQAVLQKRHDDAFNKYDKALDVRNEIAHNIIALKSRKAQLEGKPAPDWTETWRPLQQRAAEEARSPFYSQYSEEALRKPFYSEPFYSEH